MVTTKSQVFSSLFSFQFNFVCILFYWPSSLSWCTQTDHMHNGITTIRLKHVIPSGFCIDHQTLALPSDFRVHRLLESFIYILMEAYTDCWAHYQFIMYELNKSSYIYFLEALCQTLHRTGLADQSLRTTHFWHPSYFLYWAVKLFQCPLQERLLNPFVLH